MGVFVFTTQTPMWFKASVTQMTCLDKAQKFKNASVRHMKKTLKATIFSEQTEPDRSPNKRRSDSRS